MLTILQRDGALLQADFRENTVYNTAGGEARAGGFNWAFKEMHMLRPRPPGHAEQAHAHARSYCCACTHPSYRSSLFVMRLIALPMKFSPIAAAER
jgi:hypothetical protein